jgi:hypothetical protein
MARRNEVYMLKNACAGCPANEVLIIDGSPANPTFHQVVGALALNNKPGPADPDYVPSLGLGVNPVTERVYVKVSDIDGDWTGDSAL